MSNVKLAGSSATEEDRLRRDEESMRKLRIFHKPQSISQAWPRHLKRTFQSIETLGSFRYESYSEAATALHSTATWRREIKLRAMTVSDVATRLVRERPSEMTWRLELEKLVGARFDLRTEWLVTTNRILDSS